MRDFFSPQRSQSSQRFFFSPQRTQRTQRCFLIKKNLCVLCGKKKILILLYFIFFSIQPNIALTPSKSLTLYRALNTHSLTELLAFYELFPETSEGQSALTMATQLLQHIHPNFHATHNLQINPRTFEGILTLLTHEKSLISLDPEQLQEIEQIASFFPNKQLKGHSVTKEEEILDLLLEEIDLSRAIFLVTLPESHDKMKQVRTYEALLDLMAIQILSKIHLNSPPLEKIRAINAFIFDEMGFRFPPHSAYSDEMDRYTFLPAVLDSQRGVCLGVSILYLCLAQRLNLPLEIITPPGHIYIRYTCPEFTRNIETTARGIHIDTEEYMGIETKKLQSRNLKEVIGLSFINEAASHWKREDFNKTLQCYLKAAPYLENDPLLQEFMGYQYLLLGDIAKGKELLTPLKEIGSEYSIAHEAIIEDFLDEKVNIEGLKSIFSQIDEKRESLETKCKELEKVLEECPQFRAGIFSLATTWIQLKRPREALETLLKYHEIDSANPTVEYYLSVLFAERLDYLKAWKHLFNAEEIARSANLNPKILGSHRQQLSTIFPEP